MKVALYLSTNKTIGVVASDRYAFLKANSSTSEGVLNKRSPKHPSKTPAKTLLSDKPKSVKRNGRLI
jgi:hypothetical protein